MSTLSKDERQALNEIFTTLHHNEGFFSRLKEKKNEFRHFLKLLFIRTKKRSKHPVRY
ncbi:hypothetical protein [Sulfurospirillum deleyianum]|uniref:Uncharacterized protein n=1 Tax=Sulfurospirillum deleyianum (strain ATCC 51133 / DSM 6946 / 5175) TaxID=525898 RepID=D1B2R1_SULD5|nr:hypothetical protein [Sulfurospirillum deleyianum]ACZ12381.1 hypothetical protein Sdel_1361 [Sulfurospirillum deleyianum DSM 6946]